MVSSWTPVLAALTAAASVFTSVAQAAPVRLDDLLRLESLEQAAFSPGGQYAVVHFAKAYDSAGAYDDPLVTELHLSRLLVTGPGNTRRIVSALPGPFAPAGERMAVYRLRGRRLQLGVLSLASFRIRWLDVDCEYGGVGRTVQWRGAGLVALTALPASPPRALRGGAGTAVRIRQFWARQESGRVASFTRLATDAPAGSPSTLMAIDPSLRHVRSVAEGAFDDLEISQDGHWAALVERTDPKNVAGAPRLQVADAFRQRRLRLVDLDAATSTSPCPTLDLLPTVLSWSPHGDRLLVVGRAPQDPDWSTAQAYVVDPVAKRCSRLASPPGVLVHRVASEAIPAVSAGWVQDDPAIAFETAPGRAPVWWRLGDQATAASSQAPPSPSPEPFAGGVRLLLRGGGEVGSPAPPPSDGRQQILDQAGPSMIVSRRSPAGDTLVESKALGRTTRLLRLNRRLDGLDWAVPLRVPAASGGSPHWLYLPPTVASGRAKPPLLVLPYPGFVYDHAPARYEPGSTSLITQAQLLAAHGYAVLVLSLPRHAEGDWAAHVGPDIAAGVAAAAATGLVDDRRVALWGHSFGGWAVLVAAERLEGLAAVIAEAAPIDLVSLRGVLPPSARAFADPDPYLELFSGWTEAGQGELGAFPWAAPDRYVAASPLFHADRIHAPVLLMTGDQDFISPGQSEEMFAALRRLDRSAELLTFWGEGHVLASPANIRAQYAQVFAFLDRAFTNPTLARTFALTNDDPKPRWPPSP